MDIEQLSKAQIILLTLLVSFVTSIATGIVTVSLMDQAPPIIAQSVSRVIERTIETVASTTPRGQAAASVITQQKTVVVKESDLISQAVLHISPSVVRLYTSNPESPRFLGLGVVVDNSGTIASDAEAIGDGADAIVELSDGMRVRTFVTSRNSAAGIAYFASATTSVDAKVPHWTPVAISAEHPLLGETVVVLAGKTVERIAGGIVTALVPTGPDPAPQVIETDIVADSILPGSPLINTDGSLVGLSTGSARTTAVSGFISASVLMKTAPPEASADVKK